MSRLANRVAVAERAQKKRITEAMDALTREQTITMLCIPPETDGLLALTVVGGKRPIPAGDEAMYTAAVEGARAWLEGRPHPTHAYAAPVAAAMGYEKWVK
jgi:hypothetical protein